MKSSLLSDLLASKKLKSKDDLTPAEKANYDKWEKVLSSEVDVELIETTIKSEIKRLEEEWLNEDDKNPFVYLFHWKKEIDIKARLKNYNNILRLISNKSKEKETLANYIKSLINNKS